MIYIFEDFREDILSKLFMYAYSDEKSSQFVYAGGNSKLRGEVEYYLRFTERDL